MRPVHSCNRRFHQNANMHISTTKSWTVSLSLNISSPAISVILRYSRIKCDFRLLISDLFFFFFFFINLLFLLLLLLIVVLLLSSFVGTSG